MMKDILPQHINDDEQALIFFVLTKDIQQVGSGSARCNHFSPHSQLGNGLDTKSIQPAYAAALDPKPFHLKKKAG
jgi:hypothetical protein